MVYTDNNPLAYVRESKIGVAQIQWLSKPVLFDFDIKYRTGRSNKAADALSHCPNDSEEMDSNPESEEYETILYAIECEELGEILDGEKIPQECKVAIQDKEDKPAPQELELHYSAIDILSKVSTSEMREAQQADATISEVVWWVKAGNNQNYPKLGKKNKKNVRKYLCQFDHLKFRRGVLHHNYEIQGSKYHQLVLPTVYRAQVLKLLHDEQGHQRTEHTMALVRERFFWSMMCQDVNNWVKTCKRCKQAKGPYNDPNVKQWSLIANHPLEMLCLDFMMMDHSKDGKENILVIILQWQL